MTDALPAVFDTIWSILSDAAVDRMPRSAFATLATVDATGAPRLRTVALRSADRISATCAVYTDRRTAKVSEIARNPQVSLLVWQADVRVQLRLSGRAETTAGHGTAHLWDELGDEARLNYAHQPAPGTPISEGGAYIHRPDPAHFALLRVTLDHIDYVSLAETGHRRAAFRRQDNWRGQWLSP